VFHQVDSQGKPVTDLSHVLMCLNKLDTSSDEKLTLISRDDQTCAIVTYAEVSISLVSRPLSFLVVYPFRFLFIS
jgi:PAB-dependent poly(A)-specific ribonuclease subunit 3